MMAAAKTRIGVLPVAPWRLVVKANILHDTAGGFLLRLLHMMCRHLLMHLVPHSRDIDALPAGTRQM